MKLSALNKSTGLITLDGILSVDSEEGLKRIIIEDAVPKGMRNIILDFLTPKSILHILCQGRALAAVFR